MSGSRLNERAKGVFVIAATPFLDGGTLDLASIDRLVEFYLAAGVHGMTILGMMGEAAKLNDEESRQVASRFLRRIDGRIPIVVGVSNPVPAALVALAREAMEIGAAGVMITPQSTLKTDEQIENYFADICAQLGHEVPIVLQDYPFATAVHLSVPLIQRLIDRFPQIVMLKHEDCPGLAKLSRLRRLGDLPDHRRVSILVGSGGLYLPQELARGADGAMTGFAYPEMLVDVCDSYARGAPRIGEDVFDMYLPLLRHEAQPGIGLAIRKEVLARRGAMTSGFVRAPGMRLGADDLAELDGLMARLEQKLRAAEVPARVG